MFLPISCFFRWHPILSILLPLLSCYSASADQKAARQASYDWIRGTSDNLEMRIRGEILDVDGQPAQAPSISVKIKDYTSSKPVAVGVLATTKDQSMAGVVVAENPHRIMRLYLRPTKQLRGRLVDSQGKPMVGCSVDATLRVKYEPKDR